MDNFKKYIALQIVIVKGIALAIFDRYAQPVLIAWCVFLAIVFTVMFVSFAYTNISP